MTNWSFSPERTTSLAWKRNSWSSLNNGRSLRLTWMYAKHFIFINFTILLLYYFTYNWAMNIFSFFCCHFMTFTFFNTFIPKSQGKFIMERKSKLARSPGKNNRWIQWYCQMSSMLNTIADGNGGLYWALREEGVLADLQFRDVRWLPVMKFEVWSKYQPTRRYLHVYCVDNVLVKVADPIFMGYCIQRGAGG